MSGRPRHDPALMAAAVEASRTEKLLAVALRYRIPVTTLRRWRARAGLRSPSHPRRFDYATALSRRDAGETLAAIARDYGVTLWAIARAVKIERGA